MPRVRCAIQRAAAYVIVSPGPVAAGRPAPATRAVDLCAQVPYPGRYPWLARLQMSLSSGGLAYCSGSLIAPDTVLTAGHCVADASLAAVTYVQVALGARAALSPRVASRSPAKK